MADILKKMTPVEAAAVVSGDFDIDIVYGEPGSDRRPRSIAGRSKAPLPDQRFELIESELRVALVESEGDDILTREFHTRRQLERFSRFLDLPVNRSDTFSSLRERVIDATISFRLRSRAIQGDTPSRRRA